MPELSFYREILNTCAALEPATDSVIMGVRFPLLSSKQVQQSYYVVVLGNTLGTEIDHSVYYQSKIPLGAEDWEAGRRGLATITLDCK